MARYTGLAVAGPLMLVLAACQPRAPQEADIVGAVRDNNARAVTQYLAEGGDPDAVSRDGLPLVYLATGPRGGLDVLVALLQGGAEADKQAPNGRTALINAAGWCDAQMVRLLLAAGADRTHLAADGKAARDSVCAGPLDRRADVLNILDSRP